jgi:hypothetical protein
MGALNNALNNAISSLKNNAAGVLNGRNPLTQPQIGELFGFNIPGIPLVSTRDYFLLQLESWLTTIPLQSQWIVLISPFPVCLNTYIMQGLERTGGDTKNFDIDKAKGFLTSYPFQKVNGCIFAQKVAIPSETMKTKVASINNNRGFLPGVLSDGRQTYGNTLSIDFLETNTSFTDFVVRPWVIAGEHFGFVARDNDTYNKRDVRNVKSTIYILQYTRTYQNVSMIPRKVWTFFNCAPISVNSQSLGYDEPNSTQNIGTQWIYTNYAVSNTLYMPLPDIINRVSGALKGNFPNISPLQGGKINNLPNISGLF